MMFPCKVEDEMELKKDKLLRYYPEKPKPKGANQRRRASTGTLAKVFAEDHVPWKRGILDPGSDIMLTWNKIFLLSCFVALFVDPLYFYLPYLGGGESSAASCIELDQSLGITVTFFRTIVDLLYVLHILTKFQTAYVAPSSRVLGRGELVMNHRRIAWRYIRSDFSVDLVAALPLPQIVIWVIIPAAKRSNSDYYNNALAMVVLLQYLPRLYQMFLLSNQIIKATGVVAKSAWAGAAYNLLLYMLASHVIGASWYLLSLQRMTTCWRSECEATAMQCPKFFDCAFLKGNSDHSWPNDTSVLRKCSINDDADFNFGIFEDALASEVFSIYFPEKYLYCLWWGLKNLSSYGQNMSTTTYIGETLFASAVALLGLILFAHLIGNIQTYLQSITVRLEEWRLRQRDTQEWMMHRQLPHDLQRQVRKFIQYKWVATRGVHEESILHSLPTDLRRDIQRHLCLDLVRRVPFFSKMDDQLIDAICERLRSSLSTKDANIVREGDPVTEMHFFIRGKLESYTTNGGRVGFFNTITLRPGDFCGEELLAWALLPDSSSNLPCSSRTVRALVEVEAFVLKAKDLKFVSNQFRRLHSKKLQQTFRLYSHHWRTWAACFVQAAWRRFKRRKMAKHLSKMESYSSSESYEQENEHNRAYCTTTAIANSSQSQGKQNIGTTALASKFVARVRKKELMYLEDVDIPTIRKPEDPDFDADVYD